MNITKMVPTTESIIEKCIATHGKIYDYSLTEYVNAKTKIKIICAKHGVFEQLAYEHCKGRGCAKCAKNAPLATGSFKEKAREIHGDRYDYSKSEYVLGRLPIKIRCHIHGIFEQTAQNHLNGQGCGRCVGKGKTTESFIEEASLIHGNRYDYSLVDYIDAKTTVQIICGDHTFFQTPDSHLNKRSGCSKCATNSPMDTEVFVKKALVTHGNRYDYSQVFYVGSTTKVSIVCAIHGCFQQQPGVHLLGSGCPKCGGVRRTTEAEFIEQSKKIHGDMYDYSEIEYKCLTENVIIKCSRHGRFLQRPYRHLSGRGCHQCGGSALSNTKEFVDKARDTHGDLYDYSESIYSRSDAKVIIGCLDHGSFSQTPSHHINGNGCPKCNSKYSKAQIQWLEFIEGYEKIRIQHMGNSSEEHIIDFTRRWRADGYCADTNTIYEYHGDYFHGNPKCYSSSVMNKLCKKSMGELYAATIEREKQIKALGYNLVVLWERDWNMAMKLVKLLQNRFRSKK